MNPVTLIGTGISIGGGLWGENPNKEELQTRGEIADPITAIENSQLSSVGSSNWIVPVLIVTGVAGIALLTR